MVIGCGSVATVKYHLRGIHFHWELSMYSPVQKGTHNISLHLCCHQRRSGKKMIIVFSLSLSLSLPYLLHLEESCTCEVAVAASLMLSANSLQLRVQFDYIGQTNYIYTTSKESATSCRPPFKFLQLFIKYLTS